MARITVMDCIDKFPSRFELVLVASNRARKLYAGEKPTLEIDNDKNTVIALREIAEETLSKEQLKSDLIEEYQTTTFSEDDDINEIEDNSNENESGENPVESVTVAQDDENNEKPTLDTAVKTSQDELENSLDEDKVQNI